MKTPALLLLLLLPLAACAREYAFYQVLVDDQLELITSLESGVPQALYAANATVEQYARVQEVEEGVYRYDASYPLTYVNSEVGYEPVVTQTRDVGLKIDIREDGDKIVLNYSAVGLARWTLLYPRSVTENSPDQEPQLPPEIEPGLYPIFEATELRNIPKTFGNGDMHGKFRILGSGDIRVHGGLVTENGTRLIIIERIN